MSQTELIQIDLKSVLQQKLGSRARFVPAWAVNWLRRTVCEDELNRMLRLTHPKTGVEFCDEVLALLNTSISVANPQKLPPYERRRLLIVSNHPLGGLDGIALISCLSRIYGEDLRVIVNDILMAVKPLANVFLPINKHGRQDREAISRINEVMAADAPVVVFPAGLVSRRSSDGKVCDLDWHKMFVNKAVEFHRDVLPVFFSGENSAFFYDFALWRKRLGVKFNIEMIYLPSELLKSRDKNFSITIGDIIPWTSLKNGPQAHQQAREVKDIVYSLQDFNKDFE